MIISLIVINFNDRNFHSIAVLIGIFNNKAVAKPGAYVFIMKVAIRCGKIALKIIEPKKPMNTHFVIFDLGKFKYKKDTKYASAVIINTAK